MKFYESHREDILLEFGSCGLTKSDFHFVKRKGRIIIVHINTKSEFSYFLKKPTSLNSSPREQTEKKSFELKNNNQNKIYVNSWKEVLKKLNDWLHSLYS